MNFFNKVIWIFIIFFGFFFSFFIPPFQKPDEFVHFDWTLKLANGKINCESTIVKVPKNIKNVIDNQFLRQIPFTYVAKFPLNFYRYLFEENYLVNYKTGNTCFHLTFGYLPQAAIYKAVSWLPINGYHLFNLVRFLLFIFYVTVIYFFIKDSPLFARLISLFVLSLPMTLHQLSSFSYDGPQIMAAIVFFNLLIKNYIAKKINYLEWFYLLLFCLIFILVKPGFEAMIFLIPIFIPPNKLKNNRNRMILYFVSFFLLVAVIIFTRIYYVANLKGQIANREGADSLRQIKFLIDNFDLIPSIIYKTLNDNFMFYVKSMVGIFGWLDYDLNFSVYIFYFVFMGFVIGYLYFKEKIYCDRKTLSAATVILLFTIINIFLGTYLTWVDIGGDNVYGVQGRYFLIVLPWLILLFVLSLKNFKNLLIIIFILFISFRLINSVYRRYFDYRINAYPLEKPAKNPQSIILIDKKTILKTDYPISGKCFGVGLYFPKQKFDAPLILILKTSERIIFKYAITTSMINSGNWQFINLPKTNYQNSSIMVELENKYSSQKAKVAKKIIPLCILK
jgi:uncharacterized membrane protein